MSVRETNTICVLSTKGGAAMRIRGIYICVILAVLLVSCSGTAAVLTAAQPEVLTAALPDGVGLATASGYVGEPVAYQDEVVYMFMVGDESAPGSMYYQLFEYDDSEFTPISPAADRVFCGDEYVVYMNVDRSTGECEYFADSYDFDNRTELVLPDGCGLCFIDGERLYYTYDGSYYYCDISDGESAAVGISADEYILLAADNERLLFLPRGNGNDCRGLMLYDRNSGGRIVGTLDDDCNMEYMSSHTSALICGEYAYLTLVGDYAGAENTRRLARVKLADGESLAFGETEIISPSVDGYELISCGIELAAGGGSVYAESSIYSTASFENRDGRVNLLYSVGADGCTVYPEIPVDSVGLVRVFGEKLIICEPNGDKLKTRIYELD